MTDISPTPAKRSNIPWFLGIIILGVVSAGLTFMSTANALLCASIAALVVSCLCFGWYFARWQANAELSRIENAQDAAILAKVEADGGAKINAGFARRAIEATPNPIIVLAQNGAMIASNQAARTRFSIKQNHTRFNQAVRRPDLVEAIEAVFESEQARSYVIETRVPIDRFERISIAPFQSRAARYVLLSVQDETEIRLSERMRADFLANASHELRTPLAAIIGFIETLRGPARDDDEARTKFLEVMHLQADRMSRLISDLLSLSRIELNERVAPTDHINLTASVFEAVDGLTPDKKNRIVLPENPSPVWILGDRDQMAQVISNLLDNALKYGGAGEKVSISLSSGLQRDQAVTFAMRQWETASRLPLTSPPIEPMRSYSVLRVEDNGTGIARQFLPRLAERFFRVEDTASGKSGTGLGLAIVKHIVSRHRGGLVVESEFGRGSAFSVYLPQPDDAAHLN
jgi:two-component system, OmpR family, phosphate regulon sensor histidine kinase PhoR